MKYFIIENDVQKGPFTMDELKDKKISSDTLVWTEGMENWTPAWQVAELRGLLYPGQDSPTPPPYHPHQQFDQPSDTSQLQGDPQSTVSQSPNDGQALGQPRDVSGTGASTGSVPPMQQSGKGKRIAWAIGFSALLIALILIFTCPTKEQHQEVIRQELTQIFDEQTHQSNDIFEMGMNMFGKMIAGNVINTMLEEMLTYHNDVIFSKTTIHINGRDHTVSYGFLGKVFTVNKDDVDQYLKDHNPFGNAQGDVKDESEDEGNGTAAAVDTTGQDDSRIDKDIDQVANTVGKMVKKQVEKETDSTTSEGIGKVIDEVIKWIKGE